MGALLAMHKNSALLFRMTHCYPNAMKKIFDERVVVQAIDIRGSAASPTELGRKICHVSPALLLLGNYMHNHPQRYKVLDISVARNVLQERLHIHLLHVKQEP